MLHIIKITKGKNIGKYEALLFSKKLIWRTVQAYTKKSDAINALRLTAIHTGNPTMIHFQDDTLKIPSVWGLYPQIKGSKPYPSSILPVKPYQP